MCIQLLDPTHLMQIPQNEDEVSQQDQRAQNILE